MSSTALSSWSWRHRLYAFLLRRALGPFLSKQSTADLHRSILNIDWSEGKLVLVDVELDADHLNSTIAENAGGGSELKLSVRRACIRRLSINIGFADCSSSSTTSTTRKATAAILRNVFSTSTSKADNNDATVGGMALKVHVDLDGLSFVLSPTPGSNMVQKDEQQHDNCDFNTQNSTNSTQHGHENIAAPGFFSSLVDSAMKSLRLSINVTGLKIRTCSHYCSGLDSTPSSNGAEARYSNLSSSSGSSSACWVDVRLASARYYDLDLVHKTKSVASEDCFEKRTISKALDLEGFTIDSNSIDRIIRSESPQLILQTAGLCIIRFTVIEKWSTQISSEEKPLCLSTKQKIDVSLGERITVNVDPCSLNRMMEILNTVNMPHDSEDFVDAFESYREDEKSLPEDHDLEQQFGDAFYKETYDQIMKQFTDARHLARTRELRGGLLVPEQNDNEDLSFDTFFDANDHSLIRYYSNTGGNEIENQEYGGEVPVQNVRESEFALTLLEFTIRVDLVDASTLCFRSEMRQDDLMDCILMSMGDMRITHCHKGGNVKLNFSVTHLELECQLAKTATLNESIFRFLDSSGGKIPNQPCISVAVDSFDEGDECTRRVDVNLHPIEIIYHERAVTALCKMIERLSPFGSQDPTCDCENILDEERKNHMFVTAQCPSIVLMIACQDYSILQNSSNTNLLFQRHGYVCEESGGLFLGIGIELDNVTVDISKKYISIDSDSSYEDQRVTLNSSNALLFSRSTELKRGRRRRQSYLSRRVDLVAFTRDEDSDSNTLDILFQQRQPQMRRTSAFPFVIPLTSVKAQQESDDSDDEIDNLYEDAKRSAHERMTVEKCQMESSDPQYIMSAEANEAEKEFRVDIASIFFDLTADERRSLSIICLTFGGNVDEQHGNIRSCDTTVKNKKPYVGLSLNVGQIVSVLHDQDASISSFSLVVDNIQLHALIASDGIRNLRFFFADVVLYQLSQFNPAENDHMDLDTFSLAGERCQRIRSRLMTSTDTVARAIFFRSKLCRPMSPETPAFLVDVLFRNGACDDEYDEIGIHFVIYDMTYRYEMNSDWMTSLSALVKSSNTEDSAVSAGAVNETNNMSLFNVVVKVADCNIDYTPPPDFRHGSRIIVRLGGVRLASNIVSPSVSVQAFKISLTDLRLYICSHRFKHNAENILLSCAHRFFSSGDLQIDGHSHVPGGNAVSWEDVLFRMNFVNLIVLDSLDAVILQTDNDNMNNCRNDRKEPAVAVALTLGHFSLYACRDSFSCFAQTYNEWFIQTTSLTDNELESLRLLSEAQSDDDIDKGRPKVEEQEDEAIVHLNHTTTPLGVTKNLAEQNLYRDEVVSMNLTETLLFENYYTIDATIRGDQSLQHRQMDMMEGSEECDADGGEGDDEWATVEHDYTKFCGIPTDKDQRAEWIVCKSETPDSSSQKLKIFPQHVPVNPVSDPLSESRVDSAKLAGTELAPDIGLRIIVKDASITIRLFDGFDYVDDPPPVHTKRTEDRRDQLLCNLMGGEEECSTPLLSRKYNDQLDRDKTRRREHRNVNKYFQVSFKGLKLKQDSYKESKDHRLASYLDLSISDFYLAEAISNDDPLKLMGEWVNETEHPRDDSDGIIMLKIVTKHPSLRVSVDGKLMSDESQATLELLPLRCYLNQKALRFVRNFFAGTPDEKDSGEDNSDDFDEIDDDELINIFFRNFKVLPCKLKVDYVPEKMDIESLRDGNYTEILNLCPLEDMIINLAAVENHNLTGWGAVFSELAGKWIEDICSTQAHKFFTRAAPIQLLSTLGDGVADLALVIIVPEDNASAYLRNVVGGTTSFASKVAVEAISTSAKLTRFAANQLTTKALPTSPLPSRPRNVPRNAGDTASHAYRSLLTGLREANHNICVIPFREYQQSGASGAALGAMRGIPLGVVAPIAGASEALSYTLLGIRNQLKPEKRKEEENSFVTKD